MLDQALSFSVLGPIRVQLDGAPVPVAAPRVAITQASLRNVALFVLSVLAVYWLQPAMPVRQMDFWLPTASLALTVIVWAATSPTAAGKWRPDRDGERGKTGPPDHYGATQFRTPRGPAGGQHRLDPQAQARPPRRRHDRRRHVSEDR